MWGLILNIYLIGLSRKSTQGVNKAHIYVCLQECLYSDMDVSGDILQAGDTQQKEKEGNKLVKELSIFCQYPMSFCSLLLFPSWWIETPKIMTQTKPFLL